MASPSDLPAGFDPVETVRAYHAAIDAIDFDAVERFFADAAVYRSAGTGGVVEGKAAILAAFRRYFSEFPDQRAEDSLFERTGPNTVRSLWSLKATSEETGTISERSGEQIVTFDAAGKIVLVEVRDH